MTAITSTGHVWGQTTLLPVKGGTFASIAHAASTLFLWALSPLRIAGRYHDHADMVTSVEYVPALSLLCTASMDKTIRLYAVNDAGTTLSHVTTLEGHSRGIRQVSGIVHSNVVGCSRGVASRCDA